MNLFFWFLNFEESFRPKNGRFAFSLISIFSETIGWIWGLKVWMSLFLSRFAPWVLSFRGNWILNFFEFFSWKRLKIEVSRVDFLKIQLEKVLHDFFQIFWTIFTIFYELLKNWSFRHLLIAKRLGAENWVGGVFFSCELNGHGPELIWGDFGSILGIFRSKMGIFLEMGWKARICNKTWKIWVGYLSVSWVFLGIFLGFSREFFFLLFFAVFGLW